MQVLFKEYASWWSQFFPDVTTVDKMAIKNKKTWLIDILSSKLKYLLTRRMLNYQIIATMERVLWIQSLKWKCYLKTFMSVADCWWRTRRRIKVTQALHYCKTRTLSSLKSAKLWNRMLTTFCLSLEVLVLNLSLLQQALMTYGQNCCPQIENNFAQYVRHNCRQICNSLAQKIVSLFGWSCKDLCADPFCIISAFEDNS